CVYRLHHQEEFRSISKEIKIISIKLHQILQPHAGMNTRSQLPGILADISTILNRTQSWQQPTDEDERYSTHRSLILPYENRLPTRVGKQHTALSQFFLRKIKHILLYISFAKICEQIFV